MMLFTIGQEYPGSVPNKDGPVLDFLTGGPNRLVLCDTKIPHHEIPLFTHGLIKVGLLRGPGAMRFVWRIFDADGDPFFTFDTPFDPRILPEVDLFKIDDHHTRMVVHFHVIERTSKKLVVMRAFTLAPQLTREFHNAVIAMQRDTHDGKTANAIWDSMTPSDLFGMATMYVIGQ